ncbi:MAG: tRNA guanosine(34) transglycosylase Tgt [bacterium]|nr:tRNA guanosine(34) transglycosylase Tgt [bacterium]
MFNLKAELGGARRGTLRTAHGDIETPFFMPIATKGAVKYLDNSDFKQLGNQILLSNAYHLYLRPGIEKLNSFGHLHKLMNWQKPILTDSGGFQVFSLARLRKLTDDGVVFNSHIDGKETFFTPELSMEIQDAIGSDIRMCFDYFPGYPADYDVAKKSVYLTTAWALRCKQWHDMVMQKRSKSVRSLLFGIVQGSSYKDLRKSSAQQLLAVDFDGYAIGGLAVGEPPEIMYEVLDNVVPELPTNKPRYLMGVGQPEQVLEAVKRGVDMFDCVLPTRNARHGQVYIRTQQDGLVAQDLSEIYYEKITIKGAIHDLSELALDPFCECYTCASGYSRAYIRHLFTIDDPLAKKLTSIHNLSFYVQMMAEIREAIDYA